MLNLPVFSLSEIFAIALFWILIFGFTLQIWSWITPPNPNIISSLIIGSLISSLGVFLLYRFVPLAIPLLSASLSGVYDAQGVFYGIGIALIDGAFLLNIFLSWGENKPIDIIR